MQINQTVWPALADLHSPIRVQVRSQIMAIIMTGKSQGISEKIFVIMAESF